MVSGKDPLRVKFGLAGLYIQITVINRLNVTVGVRADIALFHDKPLSNRCWYHFIYSLWKVLKQITRRQLNGKIYSIVSQE